MTEHERLKSICDEIWYDTWILFENWYFSKYENISMDVREIIFTPEFKNTFEKALKIKRLCTEERQNQIDNWDRENYIPDEQIEMQCDYAMFWLLDNLHDPVTYLYNLLFAYEH